MKILFVCTGNSCRSPMAEVIAEDIFLHHHIVAKTSSRGISVFGNTGASLNAQLAVKAYGLDLSGHTSRQVTAEDLQNHDLILTMTNTHKEHLTYLAENIQHKTFTLGEYANAPLRGAVSDGNIMDPYGGDLSAYKKCAAEIKELINKMVPRLKETE